MHFSPKARSTFWIIVGLLLGAAMGVPSLLHRSARDPLPVPVVVSNADGSSAVNDAPPGRSVPITGRAAVPGQPPPPPAYLLEVFPALETHVSDWRRFAPETIVLQIDDQLRVPFRVTRVQTDDRRTVLTARIDQGPDEREGLEGAFLVSTANAADRWDAIVVFPGLEYRVTVRSAFATVEEVPPADYTCGTHAAATDSATEIDGATAEPAPVSMGSDAPAATTIDVVFLYNADALAERNQDTQRIDADCSNYVAASNVVLANSQVHTFTWRYLAALATPAYPTTDQLGDDLRAMRDNGAIANFVRTTQHTYGADQVMLLVGGVRRDATGRAWVGGSVAHSVLNYPFYTFTNGTRSTSTTSYSVVCHEFAHNFGCRHHRDDPGTNAVDGDNKYHYGHIITDWFGQAGTIMALSASADLRYFVPYFSNPEVRYGSQPVGVPVDQPRAAFNARTLLENVDRIAALEVQVTGAPTITEHPRSLTVAAGSRVDLSVTATGGGLTYQWSRNGTPIFTTQSASFSVGSSTAATAGSYTVVVSNYLGSVTSEPAVVTVTASSAVAAPGAGGSSGGGGGGGSTGVVFVIALLTLLAARRPRGTSHSR